jgi:hypothetical protein
MVKREAVSCTAANSIAIRSRRRQATAAQAARRLALAQFRPFDKKGELEDRRSFGGITMSSLNGTGKGPAMVFGIWFMGVSLFVLTSTAEALPGCSVRGQFRLTSEGPWTRFMDLESGGTCGNSFRSFGAMFYKRLYLLTPPQHGKVVLREGGHYRYFSQAGYHGSDQFMLRICGNTSGFEGCANLQYQVKVE